MNTETLIESLAQDVPRVRRHARAHRLLAGLACGAIVTLVVVLAGLGLRPDLSESLRGATVWMKWAYTSSLGLGAWAMMRRLARPEPVELRRFWPATLPVLLFAAICAAELAASPRSEWGALWLGETWMACPALLLCLSLPILAGTMLSMRRFAPTRLRVAGAAAGMAAGAWAAFFYCLHCPETGAPFVLTWYTLGIALAAGLGALAGPRALRW